MSDKAIARQVGLRELSRDTAEVVRSLQRSGEPVVITKQGQPIATLAPVDPTLAQDLALALAPSIDESSSTTHVDVAPRKTRSLDEVTGQLVKEASRTPEGRAALERYAGDLAQQQVNASGELERLYAEGADRLNGLSATVVDAWARTTQQLIEGAVDAALASAEALQGLMTAAQRPGEGRAAPKGRRSTTRKAAARASGQTRQARPPKGGSITRKGATKAAKHAAAR